MDSELSLPTRIILAITGMLLSIFVWRYLRGSSSFTADGVDPRWDRAVEISQATKQPGLVLVTADWCGGCQFLHNNVLSRSDIRREIAEKYTFFKLDMTDPGEVAIKKANQLGVHVYPTLIRYDETGRETDRQHGMTPQAMLDWLHDGE